MARLPTVGGDSGNWGTVLNEYLETAHNADGTLKLDVQTIDDLKAIDVTTLTDKQQALVAGYYAPGDGGGGQFYYDAGASDADNAGTIIAPTAGSGRWKRIYSGAVNVMWFGAKGDGTTDDTAAVQAALTAATVGSTVTLPTGTYAISSTLTIAKRLNLVGPGTLVESTILAPMLDIVAAGTGSLVTGLRFTGIETSGTFPGDTTALDRAAIRVVAADDVRVDGVSITAKSCGVRFVSSSNRGTVQNSQFLGFITGALAGSNNASAFSYSGGVDGRILNVTARNCGSGALVQMGGTRITIAGLHAVGLWDNGVYISSGDRCVVTGCTIDSVQAATGSGIKTRGSGHVVSGNTINVSAVGISLTGNGVTPDAEGANGYGTIAIGNTIDTTSLIGVLIGIQDGLYPRDFIVSRNVLRNNTGTTTNAPIILSGNGHVVSGNIIDTFASTYAIMASGGAGTEIQHIDISDNVVKNGGAGDGIRLVYVQNSQVRRNNIYSLTGNSIRLRYTTGVVVGENIVGTINWDSSFPSTGGVCRSNDATALIGDLSDVRVMLSTGDTNDDSITIGGQRHFGIASGPPSTGTWLRGDVAWAMEPAAGGVPGWVCTENGTPGTWKAMGNLAP